MSATDLYGAVVTSVPFVLLALVAESKLFGPQRTGGSAGKKLDVVADGFFLFLLALAFGCSLYGLAVDDPPDLRFIAAGGLGLGVFGVFVHAAVRIWLLYRGEEEPPAA